MLIIRGPTRLGANRRVVSLLPTTSVSKLSLKKDHPKQGFRNTLNRGFPDSSAGKESACNAGDPGSIPGLGRSPGEGIGYPLSIPGLSDRLLWYHSACVQTTFTSNKASLVPQTVENPPVVQQTQVQSLGWEDLLEEGMATHSSILAWNISTDGRAWQAHGVQSIGSQRVRHG